MKNLISSKLRDAFAVSIFAIILCISNALLAQTVTQQSGCFTIISLSALNHQPCNSATCLVGPDYVGNQCDQCFTVTIASCDGVEQPQSFEVGSVDCFSVCSPSGDFILGSLSTGVCDTVRKQVVWKNASGPIPCVGMSATDQPTFRICGSGSPQRFFIRLIAHCGTICQNPCQSAIIDIP